MNFDDFEKKLQHQPLRQIPSNWRESILRQAREQTPSTTLRPLLIRAVLIIWRELIQPCRYAWSAMAALWLAFWMINSHIEFAEPTTRMAKSSPAASEQIRSFAEQRRVLVELTSPIDLSPAERPRRSDPKPHSERVLQIRSC
jgi:hypothetical protein